MKKLFLLISVLLIVVSCNKENTDNWDRVKGSENNVKNGLEVSSWSTSTWASDVTSYSLEEVAIHNKKEDCYTWIDWKVYDVTSFFGKHPWWDDNLLKLCWIDWTEMFNSVHAKNQKAIMVRDSLYVWDLK